MSYPYIYKHEGKRVWINTGGLNAVSIEFRVVSCSGKELTLRLLHEPDCQCTRCSRSREALSEVINKHPEEMAWSDKREFIFTIKHQFFFEGSWSETSEVSMILILAKYFGAERFDIWPD